MNTPELARNIVDNSHLSLHLDSRASRLQSSADSSMCIHGAMVEPERLEKRYDVTKA